MNEDCAPYVDPAAAELMGVQPHPEQHSKLHVSDSTLAAIAAEAVAARLKHGDMSMAYGSDERKLRILMEEVGEVARELNDAEIEHRPADLLRLVDELVQVGAMVAIWADSLGEQS